MKKSKIVLVSLFLVGMISSVAGANIQTESLEFEGVTPTFHSDKITLSNSYAEVNVTPKQLFSPDELSSHVTFSGYNYQDAPLGERVEWTGYEYDTGWTHESNAVEDLLAWGSGGGADAGSKYPQNFFQIGAYSSNLTGQNESISDIFDYKFNEQNSGYNVSWNINVSSHYEHVIVDYELVFSNSTTTESVYTWQDVYSGNETERIPVSGSVEQRSATEVSQSITKDNLYENRTTEKLVVAHEPETNITGIDFKGLNHTEISINYSNDVEPELDSANVSLGKLSSPEDYEFTAYNVTYPADSKKTVKVNFTQPEYNPLTENSENFEFEYYSYILGSVATFKTDTSSEWSDGSFSGTKESSGDLALDNFDVVGANFTGNTFSIGIEGQTEGFAIKPDGTRMVIAGNANDKFYDYTLSTGWDVTTLSYNSQNYSAQGAGVKGAEFDNDGDQLLSPDGDTASDIFEYDLSTVYDIGSASDGSSFDYSGELTQAEGFDFNDNGSIAYVAGNTDTVLQSYWLSTPYDITSASARNSFNLGNELSAPTSLSVVKNGTEFYVGGWSNDKIYRYTMSDDDLTTASYSNENLDVSGEEGIITGIEMSSGGDKMFIVGRGDDEVNSYDIGESSGSYTSKVYTASEKKVWDNITVGGLTKSGASVTIWVKTSNDGFSTTLEEEKVSDSTLSGGTNTYDLSLSSGATDVRYNISYSSGGGLTSIDNISIDGKTANKAPGLENQTYKLDNKNSIERLIFDIDDKGESDIDSYNGSGTLNTFTNSSLKLDIGLPKTDKYNVKDTKGATSSDINIDLSKSDSGLREDSSHSHNLSDQQREKEINISNNNAGSIIYDLTMANYGTTVQGESWGGSISGSSKVSHTGIWSGDWITSESESTYNKYSDGDYDHTENSQRIHNRTKLTADNSQSFTFNSVDISSMCSQTTNADVSSGTGVTVTNDCNRPTFTGDWISQSVSSLKEDTSSSHSLGTQYAYKDKTLTENGGYSWTGVNITAPTLAGTCSNCNERTKDLSASGSITEYYNSSSDWITSEKEYTYSLSEVGTYDQTEDSQKLENQTNLEVDNSRSFKFNSVDISSKCSQTTSANVPSGTSNVTTDCNRNQYTSDWITQSIGSEYSDDSYSDTLDSQGLAKDKTLNNQKSVSWTKVNISAPSISGTCSNCNERTSDISADGSVTETYNSSSDWITNENETTYNKYEDSGFDHGEDTQKLINRTKLLVDNSKVKFYDVDLTSICSSGTADADVLTGTQVQLTSDCNRYSYKKDWITESVSSATQPSKYIQDLDSQHVVREKNLTETGGYSWTGVNISASTLDQCDNCRQRNLNFSANEKIQEYYNSTGDFIEQESNSSIYFASGTVRLGLDATTNYTARQNITAKNNRTDVALSVDASSMISTGNKCSLQNSTTLDFSANTKQTKKIHQDCESGQFLNHTSNKIEQSDNYLYQETSWVEVYSNRTDEQSMEVCEKKSNLANWESRDPATVVSEVDGKSVSITEKTIGGTEYVCGDVPDDFGNSSLHKGDHKFYLEYEEPKNVGSSGSVASGGGTTTIIKNVTTENVDWSVSALNSDSKSFQFFITSGDSQTIPLGLENNGDTKVSLELECISSDGSCKWVELEKDRIDFDTSSFTETTADVYVNIPADTKLEKDQYNFVIRVKDQRGNSADVDVTMDANRLSIVFDRFSRLVSAVDVKPPSILPNSESVKAIPVPFFLIPLIPSIVTFAGLRAISDEKGLVLFGQILGALALFLILTGLIPPL